MGQTFEQQTVTGIARWWRHIAAHWSWNAVAWTGMGALEAVLSVRFIAQAAAMPMSVPVLSTINAIAGILAGPFFVVIRSSHPMGRSVLEWPVLLAGIIYFLLGWGIIELFRMSHASVAEDGSDEVDDPLEDE